MFKSTALLLVAFAAGVGCSKASRPGGAPAGGTQAAPNPGAPVARVGGETITDGDLTTAVRSQLMRFEAEHAEKVHSLKSQTLDSLIEKRLVEAQAKKEGITAEKLMDREVNSKIPEPSNEELQQIYDRTKAGGRELPPFDQVKGQIIAFVKEQKSGEVRKSYIDKLRAAAKVEVLLPPLLPPKVEVAAVGPSKGDANAPVTIVAFSDYECPFCSRGEEVIKRVMDEYKGKVRLVYRDYPLPFHAKAQKASEAAHCAADQGKFWEMHTKLFASQSALSVPELKGHAKQIGLDPAKFDKCLDSGEKAKLVEDGKKAGDAAGVSGTPAFFINGRLLSGALPFERFKEIIDHELKGAGT